jgi:hypothetical protein
MERCIGKHGMVEVGRVSRTSSIRSMQAYFRTIILIDFSEAMISEEFINTELMISGET